MADMAKEAVGGFNAFLESQQKLPGEARLTLVLFDHEYIALLSLLLVTAVLGQGPVMVRGKVVGISDGDTIKVLGQAAGLMLSLSVRRL
jgi:hypothetical protein